MCCETKGASGVPISEKQISVKKLMNRNNNQYQKEIILLKTVKLLEKITGMIFLWI